MDEDGNVQFNAPQSAWVGYEKSHRRDMNSNRHHRTPCEKFILGDASDWENSGMRLQAFDSATGVALNDLGTLPYLQGMLNFGCFANVHEDMLCQALIQRTSIPEPPDEPMQQDILYRNTSSADSLLRVTDTPETSETAVAY
jgi:hypothetical protein